MSRKEGKREEGGGETREVRREIEKQISKLVGIKQKEEKEKVEKKY